MCSRQAIASNTGNASSCWLAWPASWAFPFLGVPVAGERDRFAGGPGQGEGELQEEVRQFR